MKRSVAVVAVLAAAVLALAGCGSGKTGRPVSSGKPAGDTTATVTQDPAKVERKSVFIGKLKKTEMFLHIVDAYAPGEVEYAALDGEPSQSKAVQPKEDEGIKNRVYPAYNAKTFKFLALPTAAIPPQDYYMFVKDGGTVNKALKGTGYKAVDIIDTGHIKILPNLYTGYYDFAWLPLSVMTEYWSGNESMNQELWKQGNDYVIIASSTDGDSALLAAPALTDIKQLDGKTVGIMNVGFGSEAMLNKALKRVGMSTSAVGGTVDVELGAPGIVMNDLVSKKIEATFAWSLYTRQLKQRFGFKELVPWQELGYGTKLTNVVLVVRRDILKKHPDLVKRIAQLNDAATIEAMSKGDFAEPQAQRYQEWNDAYMGNGMQVSKLGPPNLDPQLNGAYLREVYDYMVDAGYFKVPYKFDDLVDLEFQNTKTE